MSSVGATCNHKLLEVRKIRRERETEICNLKDPWNKVTSKEKGMFDFSLDLLAWKELEAWVDVVGLGAEGEGL